MKRTGGLAPPDACGHADASVPQAAKITCYRRRGAFSHPSPPGGEGGPRVLRAVEGVCSKYANSTWPSAPSTTLRVVPSPASFHSAAADKQMHSGSASVPEWRSYPFLVCIERNGPAHGQHRLACSRRIDSILKDSILSIECWNSKPCGRRTHVDRAKS